ncbi:type IV pilus modification PilV family protein [Neobacillus jeddahensis]|uniref:type IV pilus modification PilV family protein n=1 Tax=Neobacillus jeddahensis TaxID=1461580 RepID=UPI0005900020|nr:type II secretion system protein [Neobacillus jeddahensis]
MEFKKRLCNSRGLTLIEVLISLTILGIISIGIMNFFSQAYSFTNSNQKKTNAINVARNAMMYMEKQSFIQTMKDFEDHPTKERALFICNERYTLFWKGDPIDTGCIPISINKIDYTVSIRSNKEEEYKAFILPLIVKVEWSINQKKYSTELEGVIKSEDIR